jgi:transposase
MAEAYAIELRQRVVAAYESGEGTFAAIAERFDLGIATVKRWVWQMQRAGHVAPRKKGGGTPSDVDLGELEAIVRRLGDANAGEITAEYNRGRRSGERRHVSSIKRALYRAGFVVKKNGSARSSSSARRSSRSASRSSDVSDGSL